jgi:anti-anti-sigma factor
MAGSPPIRTSLSRSERDLRFTVQWLASDVVTVVSVEGEVDAANADTLLDYVLREVLLCRGLVLDLASITFFDSEGYRSLVTLAARCATADVSWVLVPSGSVQRALRICDVAQQLPMAASVTQGVVALSGPRPDQSCSDEAPLTSSPLSIPAVQLPATTAGYRKGGWLSPAATDGSLQRLGVRPPGHPPLAVGREVGW